MASQIYLDLEQSAHKDTPFDIGYENELVNEKKIKLDQRLVATV